MVREETGLRVGSFRRAASERRGPLGVAEARLRTCRNFTYNDVLDRRTAMLPRRAAKRVWLAVVLCLVAPQVWAAQRTDDRAWYQRFVNGVASTVYSIAWPTATFRRVDLKDVS